MARTITDPEAAATFARVIASDLSLYNEAALAQSLRDGQPFAGLEDELAEARRLFAERVPPALDPGRMLLRTLVEFFARWAEERGLPSEGLSPALAPHLAPDPTEALALVVRTGLREQGRVIPLGGGVVVLGRTSMADVELPSDTVARRHTKLTVVGSCVEVQDMQSHCGTYVNGELIRDRIAMLAIGDVLQVGAVVLELVRAPATG
jgi:hypothetical protein